MCDSETCCSKSKKRREEIMKKCKCTKCGKESERFPLDLSKLKEEK